MNRFERECNVPPAMFRRARDQWGSVDPLASRLARAKVIALHARVGRACDLKPVLPSPEVVRRMTGDAWRGYLRGMVVAALTAPGAAAAAPLSPEQSEEVGPLRFALRTAYHRARALGFGHDRAMCAVYYHDREMSAADLVAELWGEAGEAGEAPEAARPSVLTSKEELAAFWREGWAA